MEEAADARAWAHEEAGCHSKKNGAIQVCVASFRPWLELITLTNMSH